MAKRKWILLLVAIAFSASVGFMASCGKTDVAASDDSFAIPTISP